MATSGQHASAPSGRSKRRVKAMTTSTHSRFAADVRAICVLAAPLIGNNLFILSKLPNVDPDAESDNLQTPSMRSMGINFNLKF